MGNKVFTICKNLPPLDSSRCHCSGLCGGCAEGSGGPWRVGQTAQAQGWEPQHRGLRYHPGVEPQTCLLHLAEALLLPHGGGGGGCLEALAEMGGSGSCCRGVKGGCCRDGGVRKLLPSL